MRKNLVLGIACLGMLTLSGTTLYAIDVDMDASATLQTAGTAVKTFDVEFGTITMDPGGDTITIDASGTTGTSATRITPSVTTTGSSQVGTTGGSGVITVTSPIALHVVVTPPATASLGADTTGAPALTLTDIVANSTASYDHAGGFGGETSYVHIGGSLVLTGGETPDSYSTTTPFTVSVDFN